jgi:hypothetical protein
MHFLLLSPHFFFPEKTTLFPECSSYRANPLGCERRVQIANQVHLLVIVTHPLPPTTTTTTSTTATTSTTTTIGYYDRVQLHFSRPSSSAETPTEGLLPESNSDRARPFGIEHSVPIAKLALLLVIATHLLPPTTPTATIATTTSSTITTRPTFILWHVHRLFRPSMPIGIRTQCSNCQSSSLSRPRHPSSPTAQRMLTTCTSTVRRGPLARASLGRNKLSYHSLSPTAKAKEGMSLTQRSAQRGRSPQSRKVFPPCRAPLPDTSPLARTL